MTPAEVSDAVMAAVRAAADAGEFVVPSPLEPHVTCVNGVYRTPVAVRIGAAVGVPARQVAGAMTGPLARTPGVGAVEITGPGFLMITLSAPGALVAGILRAGAAYGVPTSGVPTSGVSATPPEASAAAPAPVRPPIPPPPPGRAWPDRPRTFDNPGFAVRLAYARAAMVVRNACDLGVPAPATTGEMISTDPSALGDPYELTLLGLLAELPGRAERAAREQDPIPFMRQLERLAMAYHDVHERCPALPRGDQRPTVAPHGARCALAEAVRISLGNGLRMIGETPVDRI